MESGQQPHQQQRHLALATTCYEQTYRLGRSYWTGINAATTTFLQKRCESARALAQQIRQQCLETLATLAEADDAYWVLATLGEAALILGRFDEAEDFYGHFGVDMSSDSLASSWPLDAATLPISSFCLT